MYDVEVDSSSSTNISNDSSELFLTPIRPPTPPLPKKTTRKKGNLAAKVLADNDSRKRHDKIVVTSTKISKNSNIKATTSKTISSRISPRAKKAQEKQMMSLSSILKTSQALDPPVYHQIINFQEKKLDALQTLHEQQLQQNVNVQNRLDKQSEELSILRQSTNAQVLNLQNQMNENHFKLSKRLDRLKAKYMTHRKIITKLRKDKQKKMISGDNTSKSVNQKSSLLKVRVRQPSSSSTMRSFTLSPLVSSSSMSSPSSSASASTSASSSFEILTASQSNIALGVPINTNANEDIVEANVWTVPIPIPIQADIVDSSSLTVETSIVQPPQRMTRQKRMVRGQANSSKLNVQNNKRKPQNGKVNGNSKQPCDFCHKLLSKSYLPRHYFCCKSAPK